MTEDEAKTRVCPVRRGMMMTNMTVYQPTSVPGTVSGAPTSSFPVAGGDTPCLGSACMAFRVERGQHKWINANDPLPDGYIESDAASDGVLRMIEPTPTVYCGLAGKP